MLDDDKSLCDFVTFNDVDLLFLKSHFQRRSASRRDLRKRIALEQARTDFEHVEYRIADLIGESYFFKQSALASIRVDSGHREIREIWSPGENLGNVGAAVVPLMMGMALTAVQKGYACGSPVLIEASGDDGACGAAVLHSVRAKMQGPA